MLFLQEIEIDRAKFYSEDVVNVEIRLGLDSLTETMRKV